MDRHSDAITRVARRRTAQDHAVDLRRRPGRGARRAGLGRHAVRHARPGDTAGLPAAGRNRFARFGSQRHRGLQTAGRELGDTPDCPTRAAAGWCGTYRRQRTPRSAGCRYAAWTKAVRCGWPTPAGQWAGGWSARPRAMLTLARQHALDRVQFGRPIAAFQAVRHRLAETLVAIEGAEATLSLPGEDNPDLTALLAKAAAGKAALTAAKTLPASARRHRFHRRTRSAPPRGAGPGARRIAGQFKGTHPKGRSGAAGPRLRAAPGTSLKTRARVCRRRPCSGGTARTRAEPSQRRGRPSTRWAMMLRWISEVPPAIVPRKNGRSARTSRPVQVEVMCDVARRVGRVDERLRPGCGQRVFGRRLRRLGAEQLQHRQPPASSSPRAARASADRAEQPQRLVVHHQGGVRRGRASCSDGSPRPCSCSRSAIAEPQHVSLVAERAVRHPPAVVERPDEVLGGYPYVVEEHLVEVEVVQTARRRERPAHHARAGRSGSSVR